MFRPAISTLLIVASLSAAAVAQDAAPTPQDIFNQRIMPIFRSEQPSSCVQCHLASVDLKNYILPSAEDTFVSLRDQGLIDMEHPAQSKILTLINMGQRDLDDGPRLIHEDMRQSEFDAFSSWIEASVNDPALRDLPALDPEQLAGPDRPDEIIRHARRSRVVDSFARNVFSQRMRCFPCHTPHEIDPDNPRQAAAVKTMNEFAARLDDDLLARIEIFRETPEETLDYLIEASRNTPEGDIPLLNLEDPARSLLVLKPLSRLPMKNDDGTLPIPPRHEPLYHLGGLKLHPDDQTYKSFVAWIQDYAHVVHSQYASVDDLPADNWHGSQLVIRLMSVPEDLPEGLPVQMFVHPVLRSPSGWSPQPIAFTQGTVTPNRVVNGSLILFGHGDSQPDGTLPRGDYLIKVYADTHHRLTDDPTLLLGEEDLYGEVELRGARWREGFRSAETVSGGDL